MLISSEMSLLDSDIDLISGDGRSGVKCELQEDARTLVSVMSRLYPCQDCAEDLRSDLLQHPPNVTSSKEFSQEGRTVLDFLVTLD